MKLETPYLEHSDIEYVADMLRAIVWSKDELVGASDASIEELVHTLSVSEAALRRVAAEMRPQNAA